jgi:hypothetical protein
MDADDLAGLIADAIGIATAPLFGRIKALELQAAALEAKGLQAGPAGPPGPPGPRGEAGPAGDRGEAGPAGPRGEAGTNGARGESGAPGPRGETGPAGAPGGPGARGETGPAGAPGGPGARGETGPKGTDGDAGLKGADGLQGPPGRDGRDGAIGPAGRDGSLKGLRIEKLDDRRSRWLFPDGTPVEGGEQYAPAVIFRKGYQAGRGYESGDVVVYKGSSWIALEATTGPPDGDGAGQWALLAARGRDGTKGNDGRPGPEGRPGVDLTQMGTDGRKW